MSAAPTEPATAPPPGDDVAALRAEMRELLGALREASRLTVELKGAVNGLNSKLNMVALAQLAGEAKALSHDVAIKELRVDVKAIEELLTAAE